MKKAAVDEGVFFAGETDILHGQKGVWISDEERRAMELLEWYTPINVRLAEDGNYIHLGTLDLQHYCDLANMDRRDQANRRVFVPYTWLVGARVGY